jgi:penicillin-binding protein 1C
VKKLLESNKILEFRSFEFKFIKNISSRLFLVFKRISYYYRSLTIWKKLFFGGILVCLILYSICLPRNLFDDPFSTVLYDRNGILLGAKTARDGQWRFPETIKVPDKLKTAIVVFEDRYFYIHPGFNPGSIIRAVIQNIRAGHVVSGGSTITMQVIRLSRKGKQRTIKEKIIEIVLATRLELAKSKEKILNLYCSHAPYGGNIVGFEAASWRYFGYGSHDLSWGEAALLAVLPNSPALIHPGRNRMLLLEKRNKLLDKLYHLGKIDSLTLAISKIEPIPDKPYQLPQMAPHLLIRIYKEKEGTVVKSTLDASLQSKVNDILNKYHKVFRYNQINNIAALIVEVKTGNVLAYTGNVYGEGTGNGEDVDIIMAPRSTGSLLKPILYGAMIEDGKLLPGSLVPDIPTTYKGFSPQNFNQQYDGAVPAKNVIARSLNVPAVRLLHSYGVEKFHHLLKRLGMTTLNMPSEHYGLSLILGGGEGTLWDMLNIYACFSRILNRYCIERKYYKVDFHPLTFIVEDSIKIIRDEGSDQPYFFSASTIWSMYNAMHEVNRPETEAGWNYFSSNQRIAWKTGTSYGYRDGWAIGTTPEYAVGVWVGNADGEGRPGLTGISTAAPVMFELFSLLPYKTWFQEPVDELVYDVICKQSGYRAGLYCNDVDTIKIPYTCINSPVCPFHILVHLSSDGRYRVNSNCEDISNMIHIPWFVLPPVQEWYYKSKHFDYLVLPPYKSSCMEEEVKSMELIYPSNEVRIYIPLQLDGSRGRVVFEAAHRIPETEIYWHLDDQFIKATRYIHQVELLPSNGWHTITLVDEKGEVLKKKFYVIDKE